MTTLPKLDPELMAATPVLCAHARSGLAFEMKVSSADDWWFQCVCSSCFTVWKSPDVPNRILGLCWLNVYEERFGTDMSACAARLSSDVARAEMLDVIRALGVDPEVD